MNMNTIGVRRALAIVLLVSLPVPSAAQTNKLLTDIEAAREQLKLVSDRVFMKAQSFEVCRGNRDCPLRLFISKAVLQSAVSEMLEGRTASFHMTGKTGRLAESGGGGLGCGWFVEVDDNTFGANLAVGAVSSTWVPGQGLTLDPGFVFDARAQIHGHVKGPAGLCVRPPSFWTSCDCPLGGGAGSSVGVNARIVNAWPLALDMKADESGPLLNLRQRNQMVLRTTLQVGFQNIGTLGIPVAFTVDAKSFSTFRPPTLFGVDGEVMLPAVGGESKIIKYSVSFTSQHLGASATGLEYLTLLKVTWVR